MRKEYLEAKNPAHFEQQKTLSGLWLRIKVFGGIKV